MDWAGLKAKFQWLKHRMDWAGLKAKFQWLKQRMDWKGLKPNFSGCIKHNNDWIQQSRNFTEMFPPL